MAEEVDLSKLSIAERWSHSNWKARKSAYDDTAAGILSGKIMEPPAKFELESACLDSNPIALDSAIKMLDAVLRNLIGDDTQKAVGLRQTVARPLTEKGLVATKPAARQAAQEVLLHLVAVADPSGVVQDIIPSLSGSPKTVVAGTQALAAIFTEFGSPVTDPKPVIKALPPLFGHADRNIRASAVNLATALCRWVGEPVMLSQLGNLKEVQLNELKQKFSKINRSSQPPRQTQHQKQQVELAQESEAIDNGAVENDGVGVEDEAEGQSLEADPWNFADPEDVLSKIPASFWDMINSPKWKERLESLTGVAEMLTKTVRMNPSGNYSTLVSEYMRIVTKDANQMCATQAVIGLTALASGLRSDFAKFGIRTVESIVERLKEKRQSVIDAIVKCLDEVYFKALDGQVTTILDTVWRIGCQHKMPTIRLESTKYLAHLLSEAKTAPTWNEIESVSSGSVKFLADSQEPMRQSAATLIAICIKIAGEQKMQPILKGLDAHKRKRVDTAAQSVAVSCKLQTARPVVSKTAVPQKKQVTPAGGPVPAANVNRPVARSAAGAPAPAGRTVPTVAAPSRPHARIQQSGASRVSPSRIPPSMAPNQTSRSLRPGQPGSQSSSSQSRPLQSRPNIGHSPSRHDVTPDMDVSIESPVRDDSRPSFSSTPKIAKRTYQRADFTPARGQDSHRRRIYSPAKMETDDADDVLNDIDTTSGSLRRELARITAELNLEKRLRVEAEKKLAATQVENDQIIARMRDENANLKVQMKIQQEEVRLWLESEKARRPGSSSSDEVGDRLSILSIDSGLGGSRPPSIAARADPASPAEARANSNRMFGNRSSRPPPNRGVMPISLKTNAASSTAGANAGTNAAGSQAQFNSNSGNRDWERAVSMTHDLRKRVEQLKQVRERTF